MGVIGLWELLNPVKANVSLDECEGKTLAVDLSAWLVQLQSLQQQCARPAVVSEHFLCYRGVFFKTLKLLSLGIPLIFVMDGPKPPLLKRNRSTRELYYQSSLKYKELLLAMGLPVIESDGEGEKLCADLNRRKIVDGIITEDSDVFIYGGETVYRGVFSKKRDVLVEKYEMKDVMSKLKLTHRDLVAFALMSHGDFSHGVPGVGESTFLKLIEEYRSNQIEDALNRIQSWKTNEELNLLMAKKQEMDDTKLKHCTRCKHEGSLKCHTKEGCTCCQTTQACIKVVKGTDKTDHPCCTCQQHCLEKETQPFITEIKIRSKALEADPNFPNPDIVKEYLEHDSSLGSPKTLIEWPDFPKLVGILKNFISSPQQMMDHLLPAYIKLALCGCVPMNYAEPVEILKWHTISSKKCFLIKWKISDLDEYISTEDKCLVYSVPENMFTPKYPDMTRTFAKPKENKRKLELPPNQTHITEFFKVKK